VVVCLQALIEHQPEPRLLQLLTGIQKALTATQCQYTHVNVPGIFTHTAPGIFSNTAPLSRRVQV
jgi:hypothetical protein